ncbi:hypothetical protein GCM10025776_03220 [Corallincola platygyrae]
MVGTTMDADAFHDSLFRNSINVDFGSVTVIQGSKGGSSDFWPSSMIRDYRDTQNEFSKCFSNSGISIEQQDTGRFHIKARFTIPRTISDSGDPKLQAIRWLDLCDCPEDVGATCFEDYSIRAIEEYLTKQLTASLGLDRSQGAFIPLADREQMKRRLGTLVQTPRRVFTEDLGVYQRLLDDSIPHNIERIDPGKKICFQSYSFNRGVVVGGLLRSNFEESNAAGGVSIEVGDTTITVETARHLLPNAMEDKADPLVVAGDVSIVARDSTLTIGAARVKVANAEKASEGKWEAARDSLIEIEHFRNVGGDTRISALVPGALSCRLWLGIVGAKADALNPANFFVGFDPITPFGNGWIDKGDSAVYYPPLNHSNYPGRVDYWAPLDRVTNNRTSSFPFALMFTSNYKQTILVQDDQDLSYFYHDLPTTRRSNILLLFENSSLRNFVQQHYAYEPSYNPNDDIDDWNDRSDIECVSEGSFHEIFHECVNKLVKRWLSIQDESWDASKAYFHDLTLPSNIRPFTQIPIYLDNELRWVRTGVTILNILDEKFRLSEEVMKARAAETGTESKQPNNEADLVQRAISTLSLKRRRAGSLVEIQLDRVQSLDELALPLAPGDELTWLP